MNQSVTFYEVHSEQSQMLRLFMGIDNKINIFQLFIQIDYHTTEKERKKEINHFILLCWLLKILFHSVFEINILLHFPHFVY